MAEILSATVVPWVTSADLADDIYLLALDMWAHPEKYKGLKSGLDDLDAITGGFHLAWYIIWGGAQKGGKTASLVTFDAMLGKAIKPDGDPYKVGYFSFEQPNRQMGFRMYANLGAIDLSKFRDGSFDERDFEQLEHARQHMRDHNGIWFSEENTIDAVEEIVLQADLDIAIVDYIQLMTVRRGRYKSRQEEIQAISRRLKQLTIQGRERMILAASQLSREANKGNVYNSANYFRDSGAIEQDADLAVIIAPSKDGNGEIVPNQRRIFVVASRWSDQGSEIPIRFEGRFSRIGNAKPDLTDVNAVANAYLNEPPPPPPPEPPRNLELLPF